MIAFILALAHVFIWYPAEILDTAVGYVYGFWVGLPLVMAGWLVNALVAYWIGRHAARPVLYRFIGRRSVSSGSSGWSRPAASPCCSGCGWCR